MRILWLVSGAVTLSEGRELLESTYFCAGECAKGSVMAKIAASFSVWAKKRGLFAKIPPFLIYP